MLGNGLKRRMAGSWGHRQLPDLKMGSDGQHCLPCNLALQVRESGGNDLVDHW